MKKIRTLFVSFDKKIPFSKTSAFRGAVIEKVGRENILYHQHQKSGKLIYRYPLIQYKRVHQQATIFCIGEGVDEIHKLFGLQQWEIDLQGEPMQLTVDNLKLSSFNFEIRNQKDAYHLFNWLGLNEKNYSAYQMAKGLKQQLEILERVLVGNILSMAKGLDWQIEKRIEVNIQKILKTKSVTHKGTSLISFDIAFKTNVALPNYIGIGKSVSHGFGVIKKKNK